MKKRGVKKLRNDYCIAGIFRPAKVSFFHSVTSRNENWTHVFLDETGVVYQLYGKTELKLMKSSLSPKTNLWPDEMYPLYIYIYDIERGSERERRERCEYSEKDNEKH